MSEFVDKNPIIVLVGPTAVGKSGVAIGLAQKLGGEIISADSRMVYRGLDIGTAKPVPGERGDIVHHLIDIIDPAESFSAGRFRRLAGEIIAGIHQRRRVPIIVGGTGLYVKLLIRGQWEGPEADWLLREKLYSAERIHGEAYLHRRLEAVDPESAGAIQAQDLPKLVRALEVFEKTGRPLSAFHREHGFSESPYETILIGLKRSREDLYRRIEARVDEMMNAGLEAEVRGLLDQGYSRALPALKGLGYRQIAGYLFGEYDRSEAVHRLKQDTRRYAKRQLTWFKRDESVRWIDLSESDDAAGVLLKVEAEIMNGSNREWGMRGEENLESVY